MRKYRRLLFSALLALFMPCLPALAQSSKSLEKTVIDGKEFYIYEVSAAEGFYALTRQFGVTQAEIEQYNPETRSGLKQGQRILIPVGNASASDSQSDDNQSTWFIHTVATGETPESVAHMYDTTVKALQQLNPGMGSTLTAGHAVKVPQPLSGYTFHTIQPRETLYSLAKQKGVTMQAIMDANPGLNSASFATGRVVRIPEANASNAAQPAFAQTESQQQPTVRYRVKRKETLYSVSRAHNTTVTRLMELNPGVTSLQAGDWINVPAAEGSASNSDAPSVATLQEMTDMLDDASATQPQSQIKVALMLPFESNSASAKQSRYLEFYEGFLLAVDSIRSKGVSMDIYTFDTSTESLSSILATPAVAQVDLIVGPTDNSQIATVAQFADKHNINMVNPFTFDSEATESYPHLFQLNTPNSYLFAEASGEFAKLFGSRNIVFLTEAGTQADKKEFTDYLRSDLKRRGITSFDFTYSDPDELLKVDSLLALPHQQTVFVPTSSKRDAVSKIVPPLRTLQADPSLPRLSLFGYPEWQTYTNELMGAFYELDTYIYTRIYLNPFEAGVKRFYANYKYWYQKDLMAIYPRYGVLGFDTGLFFLDAVRRYGRSFDNHIDRLSARSLQTAMCFKRINNWSGFVNRSLYFVHFSPNNTIGKVTIN
jgi:LysM repeat protein